MALVVKQLPMKYRAPLILHRYEGMSYQEISDALSLPVSTIETRLHRAKKILLKKLEPVIKQL